MDGGRNEWHCPAGGAILTVAHFWYLLIVCRHQSAYLPLWNSASYMYDMTRLARRPTHQPVEHLAALWVIPNLLVFRPGDAVERARPARH